MKFLDIKLTAYSILLYLIISIFPSIALSEIAVVVGINSELSEVSKLELRRLWLGKSIKIDSIIVEPIESNESKEAKAEFYNKYLGKTLKQAKKYFLREALKGGALPPYILEDNEALIKELKNNSIAISFMDHKLAKKLAAKKKVKFITLLDE